MFFDSRIMLQYDTNSKYHQEAERATTDGVKNPNTVTRCGAAEELAAKECC